MKSARLPVLMPAFSTLRTGQRPRTITRLSSSANGSGRNNMPFTTLKIAVLAPMPRAMVATATAVKAGLLRNDRMAKAKS